MTVSSLLIHSPLRPHPLCFRYLTEGVLTEQYVLEHVPPLLHALRKCNTTVRWLLLHRLTRHRKLAQLVAQGPPAGRIVRALVRTAQLEFQIKSHMERLLETRQQKWEAAQGETSQMMGELADFFGGGRALTRVEKDEDLQVRRVLTAVLLCSHRCRD